MWAPLRRALSGHIVEARGDGDGERIDVLLAEDLLAFVDDVLLWVADVEAGGSRRTARYLAACRQQVGQLAALGADAQELRAKVAGLEAKYAADIDAPLQEGLVQLHGDIAAALKAHFPRVQPSLLEDLAD